MRSCCFLAIVSGVVQNHQSRYRYSRPCVGKCAPHPPPFVLPPPPPFVRPLICPPPPFVRPPIRSPMSGWRHTNRYGTTLRRRSLLNFMFRSGVMLSSVVVVRGKSCWPGRSPPAQGNQFCVILVTTQHMFHSDNFMS